MSANGRRTRSGDDRYMCASCPKNKQEFFKPPMQKGIGFQRNAEKLQLAFQNDQLRALEITKSRKTFSLAWFFIASG